MSKDKSRSGISGAKTRAEAELVEPSLPGDVLFCLRPSNLRLFVGNMPFLNCFGPNSSSYSSSCVVVVGESVGFDGVGSGRTSGSSGGCGDGSGLVFLALLVVFVVAKVLGVVGMVFMQCRIFDSHGSGAGGGGGGGGGGGV